MAFSQLNATLVIATTGPMPVSSTRLNKLYRENIGEEQILATLDELFARFAAERAPGERFGDFVIRAAIVRRVTDAARDFHD